MKSDEALSIADVPRRYWAYEKHAHCYRRQQERSITDAEIQYAIEEGVCYPTTYYENRFKFVGQAPDADHEVTVIVQVPGNTADKRRLLTAYYADDEADSDSGYTPAGIDA